MKKFKKIFGQGSSTATKEGAREVLSSDTGQVTGVLPDNNGHGVLYERSVQDLASRRNSSTQMKKFKKIFGQGSSTATKEGAREVLSSDTGQVTGVLPDNNGHGVLYERSVQDLASRRNSSTQGSSTATKGGAREVLSSDTGQVTGLLLDNNGHGVLYERSVQDLASRRNSSTQMKKFKKIFGQGSSTATKEGAREVLSSDTGQVTGVLPDNNGHGVLYERSVQDLASRRNSSTQGSSTATKGGAREVLSSDTGQVTGLLPDNNGHGVLYERSVQDLASRRNSSTQMKKFKKIFGQGSSTATKEGAREVLSSDTGQVTGVLPDNNGHGVLYERSVQDLASRRNSSTQGSSTATKGGAREVLSSDTGQVTGLLPDNNGHGILYERSVQDLASRRNSSTQMKKFKKIFGQGSSTATKEGAREVLSSDTGQVTGVLPDNNGHGVLYERSVQDLASRRNSSTQGSSTATKGGAKEVLSSDTGQVTGLLPDNNGHGILYERSVQDLASRRNSSTQMKKFKKIFGQGSSTATKEGAREVLSSDTGQVTGVLPDNNGHGVLYERSVQDLASRRNSSTQGSSTATKGGAREVLSSDTGQVTGLLPDNNGHGVLYERSVQDLASRRNSSTQMKKFKKIFGQGSSTATKEGAREVLSSDTGQVTGVLPDNNGHGVLYERSVQDLASRRNSSTQGSSTATKGGAREVLSSDTGQVTGLLPDNNGHGVLYERSVQDLASRRNSSTQGSSTATKGGAREVLSSDTGQVTGLLPDNNGHGVLYERSVQDLASRRNSSTQGSSTATKGGAREVLSSDTGQVTGLLPDNNGHGVLYERSVQDLASRRNSSTQRRNEIVAAIDFGTVNSGLAFSFAHDYEREPTNVSVKQWSSGGNLFTEKAPTCVLIGPDGTTLEAFGYDAENIYRQLIEKKTQTNYYYFTEFKMALNRKVNEVFSRDVTIEDSIGRPFPAMMVFSLAISFLAKEMIKLVRNRIVGDVQLSDIHWVLTVPTIWTDAAKQFMKEAAFKAGLQPGKVSVALEPEVASLYCRHLPMENTSQDAGPHISQFKAGTKFMVVDAGGGTIDVTVHQINHLGGITEVFPASGGSWGSTLVNKAFKNFLKNIMGETGFYEYVSDEPEDWLDLCRDFEIKKRNFQLESKPQIITIRLPATLVALLKEQTFVKSNPDGPLGKFWLELDKLKLDSSAMGSFFQDSVTRTTSHIKTLLENDKVRDIKAIVMVGGYSNSQVLQQAMKSAFQDIKIITQIDAGSTVLKGAVVFGHNPRAIEGRVLQYTYGTSAAVPFEEGVHPESNKIKNDHGVHCEDKFVVYAKRGEMVKTGQQPVLQHFKPQFSNQRVIGMSIFATEAEPPVVIDDTVTKIAELRIFLGDLKGDNERRIAFSMYFDKTTITAVVKDEKTDKYVKATLDFLYKNE